MRKLGLFFILAVAPIWGVAFQCGSGTAWYGGGANDEDLRYALLVHIRKVPSAKAHGLIRSWKFNRLIAQKLKDSPGLAPFINRFHFVYSTRHLFISFLDRKRANALLDGDFHVDKLWDDLHETHRLLHETIASRAKGSLKLIQELGEWLGEETGSEIALLAEFETFCAGIDPNTEIYSAFLQFVRARLARIWEWNDFFG